MAGIIFHATIFLLINTDRSAGKLTGRIPGQIFFPKVFLLVICTFIFINFQQIGANVNITISNNLYCQKQRKP